jgi:phasin family protein
LLRRSKNRLQSLGEPYTSIHVAAQQKHRQRFQSRLNPLHRSSPCPTLTADQIVAAQKANIETLFGLTQKAFEGVEKLVELNLQVARSAIGEAAEASTAVLSVKDAQELVNLQQSLLQPSAEKAAAYSRHVYDIAASTNAEVYQGRRAPSWPTPRRRCWPWSTPP